MAQCCDAMTTRCCVPQCGMQPLHLKMPESSRPLHWPQLDATTCVVLRETSRPSTGLSNLRLPNSATLKPTLVGNQIRELHPVIMFATDHGCTDVISMRWFTPSDITLHQSLVLAWRSCNQFVTSLKYIDVSRTTHTNLDVKQERRIDDYWDVDG